MKKIALSSIVVLSLFACKKENNEDNFKVKYTVTGISVDQFKVGIMLTEHPVATPFTGTRDTTVYLSAGTTVKIDAKASSNNSLIGSIYVNDTQVATLTDSDADGDSKTQIKLEYTIPGK